MQSEPTIVIDTREQSPYEFPSRTTVRKALPAGDYSLAGLECQVSVERKTLNDFVQTVIGKRERFRRELLKLAAYDRACVVVEASMDDIVRGIYLTGAHPSAVFGAAISIIVDYGIPIYFCSDRPCAKQFVERYLLRCYRRAMQCKQHQQQICCNCEGESQKSSTPETTSAQAGS